MKSSSIPPHQKTKWDGPWDPGALVPPSKAQQAWWFAGSHNVRPPRYVCWLRKASATIVINTINHSYWSYKPTERYRTGASHCRCSGISVGHIHIVGENGNGIPSRKFSQRCSGSAHSNGWLRSHIWLPVDLPILKNDGVRQWAGLFHIWNGK